MTLCNNCGSELSSTESFCWKCGSRIDIYQVESDKDQRTVPKDSKMAKYIFTKAITNLYIFFLLDIIGIALILVVIQKFTLYSDLGLLPTSPWYLTLTMFIGAIISIFQTVIYERSFLPILKSGYKYNPVVYTIIPVIHLFILLPFFIMSSNYLYFNYALGSLLTLEVAIGALHLYYRYTIISANYNINNKEGSTDQQKQSNKEKLKYEKKTLEAEKEAMINYIQFIQHKG